MKKMIAIFLVLTFSLTFSSVGVVHAEDKSVTPSRYESTLLEMTNEARRNPLAMAASLGMDTAKIAKDLPDLADILKKGLPPLAFHQKLYQSASLHAQDMLNKKYYSAISPDKKTAQERILETGYIPFIAGESLGMLSFGNFVEPERAATAIFHNMFMDELNPSRSEKRNILNPDAKDAGISFQGGGFEFRGGQENVYLVVCDFGNNDTSALESSLSNMINNARKNPRKAFEDLGMDIGNVQESSGYYSWNSDSPLSPLIRNDKLGEAARNHNQDMIRRFYFDNVSPEGKEPSDRVSDTGYGAFYVNEKLLALGFEDYICPADAILIFFRHLMKNEFGSGTRKGISDTGVSDIGMNFDSIKLNMGNEKRMNVYILTIDMASATGIYSGGSGQNFDKAYIESSNYLLTKSEKTNNNTD